MCAVCCVLFAVCCVPCALGFVLFAVCCVLCAVCSMLCALNCKNHILRENWTESRQEGTCLNTAQQSVCLHDLTTVLVRLNPDFEVHANVLVEFLKIEQTHPANAESVYSYMYTILPKVFAHPFK